MGTCTGTTDEDTLMIFWKLKREVFELNASSMLRTPHAMKVFCQTMHDYIQHYKSKNMKNEVEQYNSIVEYISVMDFFIDVMNEN